MTKILYGSLFAVSSFVRTVQQYTELCNTPINGIIMPVGIPWGDDLGCTKSTHLDNINKVSIN